jgi:hypothetical protein
LSVGPTVLSVEWCDRLAHSLSRCVSCSICGADVDPFPDAVASSRLIRQMRSRQATIRSQPLHAHGETNEQQLYARLGGREVLDRHQHQKGDGSKHELIKQREVPKLGQPLRRDKLVNHYSPSPVDTRMNARRMPSVSAPFYSPIHSGVQTHTTT